MKIAFFSNFLNHHQIPLSNELAKILGDNYTFVSCQPMSQEREAMGWKLNQEYGYELKAYASFKNYKKAMQLADESDIVIIGSADENYIKERLKQKKITFRYSERYFKKGKWRLVDPRVFLSHYKRDFRHRHNKNLFMLCASSYTAPDCKFIFSYPNRMFKWGYFTSVKEHDISGLMTGKKNSQCNILWCARLIKLKNPQKPIQVLKRLAEKGYDVNMEIIGGGVLEQRLKQMAQEYGLDKKVTFCGPLRPQEVIEHMEKANIFLFTSNKQEGWGAVLNESMSSGCAVVANRTIGSVPFLIKEGWNGFTYRNTTEGLYKQVERLVQNRELCNTLGVNAYQTMRDVWSPRNAARRLVEFCCDLLNGRIKDFEDGPMSRAK